MHFYLYLEPFESSVRTELLKPTEGRFTTRSGQEEGGCTTSRGRTFTFLYDAVST